MAGFGLEANRDVAIDLEAGIQARYGQSDKMKAGLKFLRSSIFFIAGSVAGFQSYLIYKQTLEDFHVRSGVPLAVGILGLVGVQILLSVALFSLLTSKQMQQLRAELFAIYERFRMQDEGLSQEEGTSDVNIQEYQEFEECNTAPDHGIDEHQFQAPAAPPSRTVPAA